VSKLEYERVLKEFPEMYAPEGFHETKHSREPIR
jgi:hypothetical protein